MPHHIDAGIRCERHVGEAFPPRCYDCTALAAETLPEPGEDERSVHTVDAPSPPSVGRYSSTECETHPGYYLPCEKCFREQSVPAKGPHSTRTLRLGMGAADGRR